MQFLFHFRYIEESIAYQISNSSKEGDIVAFVDPNNNVVVHYFAEWTVNERGDACFRTRPADPEKPMDYWRITKDKFVGIYSGRIPKVGGFLRVVGSPIGLIAIVVIGVSIYLIVHIFKKPTKEKQEEIAQAGAPEENIIEAEAEVPKAMAEAFRSGNLGIMDYYKMKNIEADTSMRESIAKPGTASKGDK